MVTAPGPPSASRSRAARRIARRVSSLRGRPRRFCGATSLTALGINVTLRNVIGGMMAQKSKSPENFPRLSAYLIVKGAAQAVDIYTLVFGARELYRLTEPSGKVGHAELELGGGKLMVADEYPDFGALSPITVG